ncbi:MAG: anti-anti-sigma factor [Pseudopedobacter saltans]|uniref:Anti-anti-sigma factor n=1 Tax=Pseudopedobacter saltans TaxID=151895 RepID=A0A2W5F265_9SPHI|nr:MAG: anti-anti-sigma factor [Pseudopedobacter saltans]
MDNFKLDTKEKFNVITPKTSNISDITADELRQLLEKQLEKPTKNVIINLENVETVTPEVAEMFAETASQYMEANSSFVICHASKSVKKVLDEMELLDILNITPTESEAWDIVQMEEIERELLSGDEEK